ncbi:hypothetical protein GCM10023314_30550 [Algibacter agarivorans]|uniref:DUF3592 domain-containing protein n=1 Tax=Algibacter agarivorans TaxID=1109741 RepID=A0ABP9GWN4_9FLAO
MDSKKEIRLSKKIIIRIILCLVLSFGLIFILQNFGTFSYHSENKTNSAYEYGTDRVIGIQFNSQLGSIVTNHQFKNSSLNYQVKDLMYGGDFNAYRNKLPYYIKATFNDYQYILFLWFFLSIIVVVMNKIKFKLE